MYVFDNRLEINMNILFVCTGNTCRSPMAEGIMNKIAQDNDLDIHCTSAGIFAESNAHATPEAVEAAKRIGVDISSHIASTITPELIASSDLILTMTRSHKMMLALSVPEDKEMYTLGEYAGTGEEVPDPYGGTLDDYIETCDVIYDLSCMAAENIYDKYFANSDEGK